MLARLAACPADVQALVAAASVLGTGCAFHQAATLAEIKDPMGALERAIAAGLLEGSPPRGWCGSRTRWSMPWCTSSLARPASVALHTRAAELVGEESVRLRHRAQAATGPDAQLTADLARFGRRQASSSMWASADDYMASAARLATSRQEREQLTLEAIEGQLLAGDRSNLAAVIARLRTFGDTGWRSYLLGRLSYVAGNLEHAEVLFRDDWRL